MCEQQQAQDEVYLDDEMDFSYTDLLDELEDMLAEEAREEDLATTVTLDAIETYEIATIDWDEYEVPERLQCGFSDIRDLLKAVYLTGVEEGARSPVRPDLTFKDVEEYEDHLCHNITIARVTYVSATVREIVT